MPKRKHTYHICIDCGKAIEFYSTIRSDSGKLEPICASCAVLATIIVKIAIEQNH